MSDSIFTIIGRSTKNAVGNKLDVSGGTMTGSLVLQGSPTLANEAVTKSYVDTELANLTDYARLDGATFTGDLAGTNLVLSGNLTVEGTTTTLDTTNTTITDSLLALSKGANLLTNASSDSGILIERGSSEDNAAIFWDEGDEVFKLATTSSDATATDLGATSASADLEIANLKTNGENLGTIEDFLGNLLASSGNVSVPKSEFDAVATNGKVTIVGDTSPFATATVSISYLTPSEITFELSEISNDGTTTTLALQVVKSSQEAYTDLASNGGSISVNGTQVTFS